MICTELRVIQNCVCGERLMTVNAHDAYPAVYSQGVKFVRYSKSHTGRTCTVPWVWFNWVREFTERTPNGSKIDQNVSSNVLEDP